MSLLDKNVPDLVLKSVFKKYDKDGTSFMDNSEFLCLLHDLGVSATKNDVPSILATIDSDGNTLLSYLEFSKWWRSDVRFVLLDQPAMSHLPALYQAFAYYDRDSSHLIDRHEFPALIDYLANNGGFPGTTPDVEALLKDMDRDSDGTISFGEFALWYERKFWNSK